MVLIQNRSDQQHCNTGITKYQTNLIPDHLLLTRWALDNSLIFLQSADGCLAIHAADIFKRKKRINSRHQGQCLSVMMFSIKFGRSFYLFAQFAQSLKLLVQTNLHYLPGQDLLRRLLPGLPETTHWVWLPLVHWHCHYRQID